MSSHTLKAMAMPGLERPAASVRSGTLSFEEVYDGYLDFVWRTSLRLGADTTVIDDVVQEVFLVVHQRLAEFEGRSSMRTWLFGIVRKVVGRVRRTARRKPSHVGTTEPTDLDVFTTAECGPGESAERAEELRLVQRLLDQLDDDKREAFVLAELEQMTIAEVAEAVGANPNTVASRIRAARAAFERGLEEWEASGGKP